MIQPTRNFFEFACYVSLFSQLVAGPIVRFRELQEDLEQIDHEEDRRSYLDRGWSFFAIGLMQKVLIADTMAAVIDPALQHADGLSTGAALAVHAGVHRISYISTLPVTATWPLASDSLFGMHIPINFDSPYKALNPSDFWRRWHISLSRCLKDYLYIPLGGSRYSEWLTYRNLLLTMLIGGLWHGAAWTFVIWGAYHGALLALYRRFASVWDAFPQWTQRIAMFLLVIFGWTLFRAETSVHADAVRPPADAARWRYDGRRPASCV